jgi:uncharacterized phage-associated protein
LIRSVLVAISTAYLIAKSLINFSHEKADPLSNLKLQKLLYYAQAWHLVLRDDSLFDDEIEAWVHGPVVPCVFIKYCGAGWSPLLKTRSEIVARAHLEDVWRVYGKFDEWRLERLTDSEAPWREARGELPPDAPSHNIISKESMRSYYSSLLKDRLTSRRRTRSKSRIS